MTETAEFNQKIREYNAVLDALKEKVGFDSMTKKRQSEFLDECLFGNKENIDIKDLKSYIKDISSKGAFGEDERDEILAAKPIIKEKITKREITKEEIKESYNLIIEVLKEYVDMREDYYPLIAVWIIGTYFHKEFESYPYLFINAMKGSGKSRLLKLIAALSHNGEVLASLKEAVLFRTATKGTICIDEFEKIGIKEKGDLRELLNAAYKKGVKVKRMKKQKTPSGEEQVVEEFEVFCPIAMANIWGMEEVLGDRCFTLTLERSNTIRITKLIEDFSDNPIILKVKGLFSIENKGNQNHILPYSVVSVVRCSFSPKYIYRDGWNNYIKNKYPNMTTPNYTTTLTTLNYTKLHYTKIYDKIDDTKIEGRNLELCFPLLTVAQSISDDVFDEMLIVMAKITKEREIEERTESKDVVFIDFVSQQTEADFVKIAELTKNFKEFLNESDKDDKWTNNKWVGNALKRLNLLDKKRRLDRGIEVILNIKNAKQKILIFRPEQEHREKQVKIEEIDDFPIKRADGKAFRQVDHVFLPCSSCGATNSKGWNLSDEQGKIYCYICAGQI